MGVARALAGRGPFGSGCLGSACRLTCAVLGEAFPTASGRNPHGPTRTNPPWKTYGHFRPGPLHRTCTRHPVSAQNPYLPESHLSWGGGVRRQRAPLDLHVAPSCNCPWQRLPRRSEFGIH